MALKQNTQGEVFCGSIPLHQTNQIQPQGVLLVTDTLNYNIIQITANADELFGKKREELLGSPLKKFLDDKSFERLTGGRSGTDQSLLLDLAIKAETGDIIVSAIVHEKDGCKMIEFELPAFTSSADQDSILSSSRYSTLCRL